MHIGVIRRKKRQHIQLPNRNQIASMSCAGFDLFQILIANQLTTIIKWWLQIHGSFGAHIRQVTLFPKYIWRHYRAAFIVWNGPKSSCHYQTTARDFKSTYKLNLIKHLRSFLLWIFGSFSMKCERVIFSSFFCLYSLSNQCEYLNLAIWLQNYMFSSNEHRIMR